jgi:hypothetical protein
VSKEGIDRRSVLAGIGSLLTRRGLPWLVGGSLALSPRFNDPEELPIENLQRAFIHLGYLPAGADTGAADALSERALIRFKRHASRTYRMSVRTGRPDDVPADACFPGQCNLRVDERTIIEVKDWIERGWRLPLGRFRIASIVKGRQWVTLREDVGEIWSNLMQTVADRGGTLAGPYGDTWRPLGFHRKDGASRRSFHISGRAIDLNQGFAHPPRQRYFLVPEVWRERMYWRIFCRTDRQDGSQGKFLREGQHECWRFALSGYPLPSGYYLDLTRILEDEGGLERIPAKRGWKDRYVRTEWWHYQYASGKQETFLDECELVGISEDRLLRAGYTLEEIDRRPG